MEKEKRHIVHQLENQVIHNSGQKRCVMQRTLVCVLTLAVAGSLLLGAGIAVTPATAATITYNFTGDVGAVQENLKPLFGTDESAVSMTGSMSVDSTTPGGGLYNVTNFSVTIGSTPALTHTYTNAGPFSGVTILSGSPSAFNLSVPPTITGDGVTGPPGPTLTPDNFAFSLSNPGPGPFSTNALPTTVPSLSSFATNTWHLGFAPGANGHQVSGSLTSLTAVPLPAAVVLFGVGLVALIGLGAGNWRQKRPTV